MTQWDGFVAFYRTDNLEATHQFYHEWLGLPLYKDQGACRIYQISSTALIGFCTHFPEVEPDGVILTFLTDAVDAIYEGLTETRGVVIEQPPRENPDFKIYHFFLRDPNGYKVEIQKFLD